MSQTKLRESRFDPQPCLDCGQLLNGASSLDGVTVQEVIAKGRTPFAICLHCGHLMAVTADLKHRVLTDDEISEVAGDRQMLAMMKIAARVRHLTKAENQP